VDPSLWKRRVQKDLITTSSASGEQNSNAGSDEQPTTDANSGAEKAQNPSSSSNAAVDGSEKQNLNQVNPCGKKGKDVYVVDWYGPDDSEVRSLIYSRWRLLMPRCASESPELVEQSQAVGHHSNMHIQFCSLRG